MFSPAPQRRVSTPRASPASLFGTRNRQSQPPTSRIATPQRGTPRATRHAESDTPMEVEQSATNKIFASSDQLTASFHGYLPVEVDQVLRHPDFHRDGHHGSIDPVTQHAFLITRAACFVWNIMPALGSSTCYIFPIHSPDDSELLPVASLVPYGSGPSSREPGLIITSHSGLVRFWPSISVGLSGADNCQATQLPLSPAEEFVLGIYRCEPSIYVVTTSHSRLFRLTASSASGKFHIVSSLFQRPKSVFSRVTSTLFGAGEASSSGDGGVVSVALGPPLRAGLGRDVWVLTGRNLQKWRVSMESWEELMTEQDIRELITTHFVIERAQSADDLFRELNLELLDLAVTDQGDVVILASYSSEFNPNPSPNNNFHPLAGPSRTYSVIYLESASAGASGVFEITQIDTLPHASSSDPGLEGITSEKAKLLLLDGGKVVLAMFPDAVVMSSDGGQFQDQLFLRNEPSTQRRFLGWGRVKGDEVLLMISGSMMMVDMKLDLIKIGAGSEGPAGDADHGGIGRVYSIMTQAILYGPIPENPFEFRIPPYVNGHHLMMAAEHLSRDILSSSPTILKPMLDIRAQIADRTARLNWLIQFINDNAALNKLSISTRQRLSSDAEKLAAASNLWLHHNAQIQAKYNSSPPPPSGGLLNSGMDGRSLLVEAVETYLYEIGEKSLGDEDPVRSFFKTKVHDIQVVLPRVIKIMQNTLSSYQSSSQWPDVLPESNRITLKLLNGALTFRQHHQEEYGIDSTTQLAQPPWTSDPTHLEILTILFDASATSIHERSRDLATATNTAIAEGQVVIQELKMQLRDLASVWFLCTHERLRWLESTLTAPGTERSFKTLEEQFSLRRPIVLRTLLNNDSSEHAFKLAEDYRDFRTLTELCHETRHAGGGAARVQFYIEQFKEPFAFELYQWYIEKGKVKAMFDQDDVYSALLDKFFEGHHNPRISWLHSINKGSFPAASAALLDESKDEPKLAAMHLMLSIGKLCEYAQLTYEEAYPLEPIPEVEAFDDGLDFVSVHAKLLEDFQECLASQPLNVRTGTIDVQVEAIAKSLASLLTDRPAFFALFKQLANNLIQGQALRTEDLVDLLALKDNSTDASDFAPALAILCRAKNIPEARKRACLRTIWRRIFIRDDWYALQDTTSLSDDQVADNMRTTALYTTLSSAASDGITDADLIPPSQALILPTTEELSTRFSGLPDHEIALLEEDYALERMRLDGYLGVLEVRYDQVVLLEREDHPRFSGT